MPRNTFTYIGAGQVYLRRRDTNFGLLPIADAGALSLAIETEEITQPQHTQVGGGNLDKIDRITKMGLSLTLSEQRPADMAMMLYGTTTAVAAATVTGEAQTAYEGALVMFDKQPDVSVAYVVKNQAGDATYVAGTDYNVTQLGITIIAGGGISSGDVISVSYTALATNALEILVNSGFEYELVFEGLNEANGGVAQPVVLYRCKFSPAANLDLITSEFANPELSGEVLVDTSITGAGLSRYGKIWVPA